MIGMSEIFLVGNVICAVGTLLQIMAILKNRKVLKGYSFLGSLLTFLAVALFQYGFYLIGEYLSVIFGIITMVFWALATVYSGLQKVKTKFILRRIE